MITYAKVCAMLALSDVSLEWAESQYWSTLFAVISEKAKLMKKPQKKKVGANEMRRFVKEGENG